MVIRIADRHVWDMTSRLYSVSCSDGCWDSRLEMDVMRVLLAQTVYAPSLPPHLPPIQRPCLSLSLSLSLTLSPSSRSIEAAEQLPLFSTYSPTDLLIDIRLGISSSSLFNDWYISYVGGYSVTPHTTRLQLLQALSKPANLPFRRGGSGEKALSATLRIFDIFDVFSRKIGDERRRN